MRTVETDTGEDQTQTSDGDNNKCKDEVKTGEDQTELIDLKIRPGQQ